MKKILVLATDYSNNEGKVSLHYIHTRNVEYIKQGLEVHVLNFSSNVQYELDGVKIITLKNFKSGEKDYDLVLSHAPNLRNHYVFLNRYKKFFKKFFLFFHGHEVLRMSEAYPEPYDYVEKVSKARFYIREAYDTFKFRVWRSFILNNNRKIISVFVSDWMLNEFLNNLKLNKDQVGEYFIIHNSIGEFFEKNKYVLKNYVYDFITIRSSLDGSKYCIDVVRELAIKYPKYKFAVIGRGEFFNNHSKPDNLELINKQLKHHEIIEYLNISRYSLLPTRTDSQGVMACEMVSYGIPLITSNIEICQEVFTDVENVFYIDNDVSKVDLESILVQPTSTSYTDKFSVKNTVQKEIDLIKRELEK